MDNKQKQMNVVVNSEEVPATFDHLVVLLMSSDLVLFDKSFVFSFFLSSRLFMSQNDLLVKLFEKTFYYMLHHKKLTQVICKCISRLVFILNEWARNFPQDFRDFEMTKNLEAVRKKCLSMDKSFTHDFTELYSYLAKQISSIEKYEENLIDIHNESTKKLNKSLTDLSIIDICEDPILLARQFTLIELERLNRIGPDEFLYYFINSESNISNKSPEPPIASTESICTKNFRLYLEELKKACQNDILIKKTNYLFILNKRTTNLLALISWFNRLSSLVSTEIVKSYDLNKRTQVIKLFINTANQCIEIGNYNSTMAIIAGLQSLQVSRLKETWKKVDMEKWEKLVSLTDSSNNYINYRNLLKKSKENHPNKLMIPAFSLVMKDLNFYFNGLPNLSRKGCLNISKFWKASKYILENIVKENLKSDFKSNILIMNYLLTEPLLTEEACLFSSMHCEPPYTNQEYDRLKNLKQKFLSKN